MSVWEPFVTAIAAFAATNIDDILILALFFSQVGVALKRWHIVAGQLVGFTGLVGISLLGFAFSFLIPRPYIGLLGLLPIFLGLRSWFSREDDGEPMSVTAQYLDSVNVPPPATLPALWAPVGLRYHALHHLLPGVPYHNLAEAHRRLCRELDQTSPYHVASHRGLSPLVRRLAASTLTSRRNSA